MKVITASEITMWQRCREEHRLYYVCGYRPIEPAPDLVFGALVHQGLQVYWDTWSRAVAIDAVRTEDKLMQTQARAIISAYAESWPRGDWHTVHTEHAWKHVRGEYAIAGKFDALAVKDGACHIIEHKTASWVDIAYWRRLTIDIQVGMYLYAGSIWPFSARDMIYDVIVKPGIKLGQKESLIEYSKRYLERIKFERQVIVRLGAEQNRFLSDLDDIARQIIDGQKRTRHPRSPGSCHRYGRMCDFFGVCTGVADLSGFRIAGTEHEELQDANSKR